MSRFFCVEKKTNIKVHSATSYLIFQYLQYWYYQYFQESSSICNTGITSIFQNLSVSAILVLPVFSRIFQYLQYWYYQYFPESSSICNTGITSIFQNLPVSTILIFRQCLVSSSIADTGKFWKILGY